MGSLRAALTKFFAVRKYGGLRKALAEARLAEAALQRTAQPITSRIGPGLTAQANNTSGLIGVRPRYTMFGDTPYPLPRVRRVLEQGRQGPLHKLLRRETRHAGRAQAGDGKTREGHWRALRHVAAQGAEPDEAPHCGAMNSAKKAPLDTPKLCQQS